jgi:hypothetical protein
MNVLKSALVTGALIAATSGAMLVTAPAASANVVCNRSGDCWHTRDRLDYPPSFGIAIHPDNWNYHRRGYHWRGDHFDHGYYRNGVWLTF